MSEAIKYGELDSEKLAKANQVARDIVGEINRYGISEQQRMLIIYLLSLELENVEHMKELTTVVKELGKGEVFLTERAEKD